MHSRKRFALLSAGLLLVACEPAGDSKSTGSTCPPYSTLTYETFGRDFMGRYCIGCHSSALSSSQRQGAPDDHDFDTLEGIKSMKLEHLDSAAAAGPDAVNTEMPPEGATAPTEEERRQLGEWLACEVP